MSNGYHAIVLAAGASSRMGSPKALLDFQGKTALELVWQCCIDAGTEPPIVVVGHDRERIGREAERLGAHIAVNPRPEQGQTSSLHAGLALLPPNASGFFIFPVDCPLVASRTLEMLVETHQRPNSRAPIVLPCFQGKRGHPPLLAAPLAREILELAPIDPAYVVIRRSPDRVMELEVDDPHVADCINTTDAYRAALEHWKADRQEAEPQQQ